MVVPVVWVVVVVLALVVLGGILYSVGSAAARLRREMDAAQRQLAPVLEQARETAARAAQARESVTRSDDNPGVTSPPA